MASEPDRQNQLVLPDYDGACISNVVPALLGATEMPDWIPGPAVEADQVVLLCLDGLGWDQLFEWGHLAPTLSGMVGQKISTVVPSTTATALSSLALGMTPGEHGLVGYRMMIEDEVLNVLRWATAKGDARRRIPPSAIQPESAFCGHMPPVIARSEFAISGFSEAHLAGNRFAGWRTIATLVHEVELHLGRGEPFVYAYYDGLDKVAHEYGLADHYEAELYFIDQMVAEIISRLPKGAALVVTADHGQVDCRNGLRPLSPELRSRVSGLSGEARFRWLHAIPGAESELLAIAAERHGHQAWVKSAEEVVDEGWFGSKVTDEARSRLGDVALVPWEPIGFDDPDDTGLFQLVSRHGSVTGAEMWVPLLASLS
ncbi:MAG: alkaline phosphatase family protein [Actinomycetia bacterium]|nr:alkaline phosphatase family protein [Actinomycetes bacterium]MCP4084268.1 alkaline phosphatase family protein [Actinomycetes bacterium]